MLGILQEDSNLARMSILFISLNIVQTTDSDWLAVIESNMSTDARMT